MMINPKSSGISWEGAAKVLPWGKEAWRKLLVEGEARLGGQVLATAETMMVTVGQEHFETHAQDLLARDGGDT
jgi:hypothetical protein